MMMFIVYDVTNVTTNVQYNVIHHGIFTIKINQSVYKA